MLAQVQQTKAQEEQEQAIQLQGITKKSSSKHILDWGRLNTGEWGDMLGKPEQWVAEHQHRYDLEYFDDNTGLPLNGQQVL